LEQKVFNNFKKGKKMIKKTAKLILFVCTISMILTFSCKDSKFGPKFETKEGMQKFINDLNNKLASKGGYNSFTAMYIESIGNVYTATLSKDINSNKWEEYDVTNNLWKKKSDITIESELSPSEFLLTTKDFDLIKLIPLIEQSKDKVIKEKGIKEVVTTLVSVSINEKRKYKNKFDDMMILIEIAPKSGGTNFSCFYDINGKLTDFSY
jgi:hypothetical protein